MNFSIGQDDYVYETDIEKWKCKQQSNQNYNCEYNQNYHQNYKQNCKQNYYSCCNCCKCCNNHEEDNCNKQCYHECYKHYEDFFDKFCDKFLEKCCDKCYNKVCDKFLEECCDKIGDKVCDKFLKECCDKIGDKVCDKFIEKCCDKHCKCCKCCKCDEKPSGISNILQVSAQGQVFSGSSVSFTKDIAKGTDIQIQSDSLILLAKGHIYQVSYNMNALGNLRITPELNGIGQSQFSSQNASTNSKQNVSVAGTFLVDTTTQELYLDLLFEATILTTTILGNITIIEIK